MNAFIFAIVVGQDSGRPVHPGKRPPAATAADLKPVTAREVREAFTRAGELLRKANDFSAGTPSVVAADRPATRTEIVLEMARLYKAAEPTFRFTPAPVAHDPAKFQIAPNAKASLDRLVTRGCIGRIGPLAVGPQPGLTTKEFGDALGFFMARVSQMSHLPSSKWTPMLQGN